MGELVTIMHTTVELAGSTTLRPRCAKPEACRCGQQLDTCAGPNCPRCGRTRR